MSLTEVKKYCSIRDMEKVNYQFGESVLIKDDFFVGSQAIILDYEHRSVITDFLHYKVRIHCHSRGIDYEKWIREDRIGKL